jgi:hypothetical protein
MADEKSAPENLTRPFSLVVELETAPVADEHQAQAVLADALIAIAAHLRAADLSPAALLERGFPEQARPDGTTHARWLISGGRLRALAPDPL